MRTRTYFVEIHEILKYSNHKYQRLLNDEHVDNLVKDQEEEFMNNKCFSLMQSITVCKKGSEIIVLDGQHRIEAFKRLISNGYKTDQTLPVVCYDVEDDQTISEYYKRVNSNHPINPMEISTNWILVGKQFCVWFTNEYKTYIKNTNNKCCCPNINIQDMMRYIKRYTFFERLEEKGISIMEIINKIKEFNKYLYTNMENILKYQLDNNLNIKITKCYLKNKNFPCFLGIWRQFEWLEIVFHCLSNEIRVSEVKLSMMSRSRPKIPKYVRGLIWTKRNGERLVGVCHVCDEELNYDDMECGHIIPYIYGGSIETTNLEPICRTCNRDMGVLNLNEYKIILKQMINNK